MNANVSKTNTGKILVALMAMIMVAAGAVVLLGDNVSAADEDAAISSTTTYSSQDDFNTAVGNDNVITFEGEIEITISCDIKLEGITIEAGQATIWFQGDVTGGTINGAATNDAVFYMEDGKTMSGTTVSASTAKYATYVYNKTVTFTDVNIDGCLACDLSIDTYKMTIGGTSTVSNLAFIPSSGDAEYTLGTNVDIADTVTITTTTFGYYGNDGEWNTSKGAPTLNIPEGESYKTDNIVKGNNGEGSTPRIEVESGGSLEAEKSDVPINAAPGSTVSENLETTTTVSDLNEVLTALNEGNDVTITGQSFSAVPDYFIIPDGRTLTLINCTIRDYDGVITVANGGTLVLDGADIYAPVNADTENGATVVLKNTKAYTISNGTITSPIEVGYGNTVNAESITVQSGLTIDVFGNFNVSGSLRITDGAFNVYQGGTATVSGNLNIASSANIDGVLNVNSNVTVQGSGSDSTFTVGANGEVNVASGATFTVARGNSAVDNTLTIAEGGEFNVEGTLAMNGILSGAVNVFGTVQINGVLGGNSIINLYDGTSITVTSISGNGTNTLTITDKKAATDVIGDLQGQKSSQGNEVVITPANGKTVGGITASVVVTQFVYKGVGSYIADMTIGGTIVSSANSTVQVTGATGTAVEYNADGETRTGYVHVNDMALSAGTALTFVNGSVFVEGTLDATAAANASDGRDAASVAISAGTVTVNGMIKTTETLTQYINAGHYETLVDTTTIHNYVNADAAIAAIGEAQMNQVNFYGETTVTVDATIPANAMVTIESGAVLNVDATLTIADNAYVTNNGTIQVDDTLVITNYLATINSVAGIDADVMTESGDDRTYMSLATAMASGATEIVLNQDVTIEKDTTIPEGVTITSDQYGITVADKVTLTVDGAIELTGKGKVVDLGTTDSEIVINGYVSTVGNSVDLATVPGAHFTAKVEGQNTNFVSNVAYAAENCSEGTVIIYGNISAGDVTFTATEKSTLTIKILDISATEKSTLTIGTLTLVGATLDLTDNTTEGAYAVAGTITGTVAVSASDAVVGSIDADKATDFKLAAGSETTVEGTDNYAYLTGTITGDVTVSAGTITVGAVTGDVTLTVSADSTMTVASGATLALADEMTVETAAGVSGAEEDALLTVDGTITVGEGVTLTIKGDAVVNGTMDVLSTEDGKGTVIIDKSTSGTTYAGTLDVAGAVTVGTYNDNDAIFNVKGVMSVGAKPTSLEAAGSVGSATGTYTIEAGAYVKVYNGADVAGAEFSDGITEAVSTVYYINGYEYMTVYANGEVNVYTVIDAEVFEISGIKNGVNFEDNTGNTGLYDIESWFTNESMAANTVLKTSDQIGKVSAVYTEADAADVIGTVSEGDGLTLYIDNVPISASSAKYPLSVGTHTVAYTVQAGYNGDNAVITFNGQTVQSGGTITITADMDTFTLTVTGAVPATSGGSTGSTGGDDGMGLTDYLLIILVVLIVIMAVIVALRLMRS